MPDIFHLILLGPLLTAAIVILLGRYFLRKSSDPLRARITRFRMFPFAIFVGFSPALSAPFTFRLASSLPLPVQPFALTCLLLSVFGATGLAASWVMLSSDPAKTLPLGRTTALALFMVLGNVCGAIACLSFGDHVGRILQSLGFVP